MAEVISSLSNPQVKEIILLQQKARARKTQGLFVAEGTRMVLETPENQLEAVYCSQCFYEDSPMEIKGWLEARHSILVTERVFQEMSATKTPQGILAIVRQSTYKLSDILSDARGLIIYLEDLQDPGNLGTIIRTGEGAGISGLILSKNSVDIYNPKVVRATMGSLYRVPFVYVEDFNQTLVQSAQAGITLFAAHLRGDAPYYEKNFKGPCGFLIGNEGNGLSDGAAKLAHSFLKIPMAGQLESLNASVAAAILMYEAKRQKNL